MNNQSASCSAVCPKLAAFCKLLLRLTIGVIFFQAGWMKLQNPAMVQGMLTGMNFPFPDIFSWVLILAELIGGALMILGLWTTLASIPLMITMLVAFFTVSLKNGFDSMDWYIILIFFTLAYFATAGAGKISLDNKLSQK